MPKNFKSLLACLVAGSLLTGCGTTTLQTQSKLTRTITLDHSTKKSKIIYLQVTNTAGSGGEKMKLKEKIENELINKGYKIVSDSKNAGYGLFINVLFANNLKEANAIKGATNAGLLAGTSKAIAGGSGTDSLIVGATVALGAGLIGHALEDEIFRAVVDITVREYSKDEVTTIKTVNDSGASVHNTTRSGNLNQLSGTVGLKNGASNMSSGINESVSTKTTKKYEDHKTRAFVEAIKVNLKLDEAMPIMESKISKQITNLF